MDDIASCSLSQAHALGAKHLADAGKENADRDAGILLEHATGHGALSRLTSPNETLSPDAIENFMALIARRAAGEPVHRITSMREFYGLPLNLNEATLEPRPDTEVLIDMAVPLLRKTVARRGTCEILDLGAGTGAIALALLNQIPEATAIAVDVSERALEAARDNAHNLGLADRFTTRRSDWFSDVTGRYDLIISNPPYINSRDIEGLAVEVRDHDPLLALDGGADGLDVYGILSARALPFLSQDGHVIVEIGHSQRDAVKTLFEAGGLRCVEVMTDLGGQDRALCFTR